MTITGYARIINEYLQTTGLPFRAEVERITHPVPAKSIRVTFLGSQTRNYFIRDRMWWEADDVSGDPPLMSSRQLNLKGSDWPLALAVEILFRRMIDWSPIVVPISVRDYEIASNYDECERLVCADFLARSIELLLATSQERTKFDTKAVAYRAQGLFLHHMLLFEELEKVEGPLPENLAGVELAVQVRRKHAAANPSANDFNLAFALEALSDRLAKADRADDAVAAAEEAAQICRKLTAADASTNEAHFAVSLNILSMRLGRAGRLDEALNTGEEAIKVLRSLAIVDPAQYEKKLAASLSNLSSFMVAAGWWGEALSALEEAVRILRHINSADPIEELSLSLALQKIAIRMTADGQLEESLCAIEEAVTINRKLAAANGAYEIVLARSLQTLARSLDDLDYDGVDDARNEAMQITNSAEGVSEPLSHSVD